LNEPELFFHICALSPITARQGSRRKSAHLRAQRRSINDAESGAGLNAAATQLLKKADVKKPSRLVVLGFLLTGIRQVQHRINFLPD